MELRYEKWVRRYDRHIFDEQREMCRRFQEVWGERSLNIPVSLQLVLVMWLTMARGTVIHLDLDNVGLSLAFYLGFDWGNTCGVGIPELRFLWRHGPGSVIGIRAWQWYHMSLVIKDGFKLMGAGLVKYKKVCQADAIKS